MKPILEKSITSISQPISNSIIESVNKLPVLENKQKKPRIPIKNAYIRFLNTNRNPPIVPLQSESLKVRDLKFYVDSGADISLIKTKFVKPEIEIDTSVRYRINGVTPMKDDIPVKAKVYRYPPVIKQEI